MFSLWRVEERRYLRKQDLLPLKGNNTPTRAVCLVANQQKLTIKRIKWAYY
jgi:hypothetical protein